VRYVWLRRRNKVAQGISHFRAGRSDIWEVPSGGLGRAARLGDLVTFDFERIDHCVERAIAHDQNWGAYFERHALTPTEIAYEDLVDNYDWVIRRVLASIDVPHDDLPRATPQLRRLADAKSEEWENKYLKMKART
jgi:LPS sulfotransferase NodH